MALSLEELPNLPYLVPAFKPTLAGVDYLNLRQVNLDLMAECIPGTNNATRRVRGYSLICWVYFIYPRLLESRNRDDAESQELIHFREKVETLFVWGHQLAGMTGIPGISSKPPPLQNGKTDLRFAAWKRSRTNTSFEAAVQYGPSLLDLGGLGLLHKIENGIYACTTAGQKLGEALDRQLRQCPAYTFLTDIEQLYGTAEHASALFPHWRIDNTSLAEAEVFRTLLWNPEYSEERTDRGRRASFVEMVLSVLRNASQPLEVSEIRSRLALPTSWKDASLPSGQLRQSRSWLVLQLRQLQRLALESLMSWLEVYLINHGHQFPDVVVEQAQRVVFERLSLRPDTLTEEALGLVSGSFETLEDFQRSLAQNPDRFSPWTLAMKLRQAVLDEDDEIVGHSFHSLLLLYRCRHFLEASELFSRHLEHGGSARVSIAHWFGIVDRLRDRPLKQLIDWTFKKMIISQHLAVGTQRYDGLKIRLRMVLEEDGLETLVRVPWQPNLTPDRLEVLLSLMESCGAIEHANVEGFPSYSLAAVMR